MNRKFCPKCKSEDVQINLTPTNVVGTPQNWKCNNCGYTNNSFPEVELNLISQDIKGKVKRRKLKGGLS